MERKNPERRLLFRIFYRSDPGEARTLDPMIKSHLLYQLSYGVRLFSISVAKVRIIFELASVFANFFREKCDFFGFSSKIAFFRAKMGLFPIPNGIKNRPIGFVISREGGVCYHNRVPPARRLWLNIVTPHSRYLRHRLCGANHYRVHPARCSLRSRCFQAADCGALWCVASWWQIAVLCLHRFLVADCGALWCGASVAGRYLR